MVTALDLVSGLRFNFVPDGHGYARTTKKQGRFLIDLIRREQRIRGEFPEPAYLKVDDVVVFEVRRMGRRFANNNNGDVCHVMRHSETK